MAIDCSCKLSPDPEVYADCRNCDQHRHALCDRAECSAAGRLADTRVIDDLPLCWAHALEDNVDALSQWMRVPTVEVPPLTEEIVLARLAARAVSR